MGTIELREDQMLEAIGIDETEQAVYENLLARPGQLVGPIAEATGLSASRVRKILGSLEAKGLLNRSPGKSARYVPAPPGIAWEVMILQRQEQLDNARLAAKRYEQQFREVTTRTSPIDLVEVVSGREAVARRFAQLQEAARQEVMVFDRPPYAGKSNDAEFHLLERGIRCRAVYHREVLERAELADSLWRGIEAGEEARSHPGVPMKLFVVDRRIALVPLLSSDSAQIEGAVLVYESSLLDALIALWETYWHHGSPLDLAGENTPFDQVSGLSEVDERIVALLLSGLKSQAIARQVGMGKSTIDRRLRHIARALGAETRFQAGYRFAEFKLQPLISKGGAAIKQPE